MLRKSDQASFFFPVYPIRDEKGVRIGSWWYENGEFHCEHEGTGLTWASDSKEDAISVILSQHKSFLFSEQKFLTR